MKNINLVGIGITVLVTFVLGLISIWLLEEYGWTLFFFVPLLIGFLPPFIAAQKNEITRNEAFKISFITFGIVVLCLLLFAIEGLICIAMALPFGSLAVWLGSYLGYISTKRDKWNNNQVNSLIILFSLGFLSFDAVNEPTPQIPVTTSIIINAPIESVWNHVVTFDRISEPEDWVFRTGIAYPTDATIKGKGVGAIRYCNFTTGSFVEPITTWNEPNLLQFDVIDQPTPMNEFNPFWDIHPKHLDGYFMSHKGQFKLTDLGNGKTQLQGTTWYSVNITPEFYWSWWSDFIIHRIHNRVLKHIKICSEV